MTLLPPDLAALCTPRLDHLGPLAADPVPEAPTIGLASAGRALIDPRSARSGLYTTFAREVEPTIPALVSKRNPYGTERVAAILRRLDRMRDGLRRGACRCGCGAPSRPRVIGTGAGGRGGKRPDYATPECAARAKNARRRAKASRDEKGSWCCVDGCERAVTRDGRCRKHYDAARGVRKYVLGTGRKERRSA